VESYFGPRKANGAISPDISHRIGLIGFVAAFWVERSLVGVELQGHVPRLQALA
jgi:hypothetical protein